MESRFLAEEGDLACKLMAALQGANIVGADTRCAANGTSSLFAFVKVAQPADAMNSPSFIASVRTPNNSGIEPIDSLQSIFSQMHTCSEASIEELLNKDKELVKIIDFMGRETNFKPNTALIFIYSDGTRERVIKLAD